MNLRTAGYMKKTATGLIAWYIRATGCRGWTSFWRVMERSKAPFLSTCYLATVEWSVEHSILSTTSACFAIEKEGFTFLLSREGTAFLLSASIWSR